MPVMPLNQIIRDVFSFGTEMSHGTRSRLPPFLDPFSPKKGMVSVLPCLILKHWSSPNYMIWKWTRKELANIVENGN